MRFFFQTKQIWIRYCSFALYIKHISEDINPSLEKILLYLKYLALNILQAIATHFLAFKGVANAIFY